VFADRLHVGAARNSYAAKYVLPQRNPCLHEETATHVARVVSSLEKVALRREKTAQHPTKERKHSGWNNHSGREEHW
jgi:hypothetical protein